MCDVQISTGLSITIAGFTALEKSSFYHQQIIASLWWMNMNSIWVARIQLDNMQKLSEGLPERCKVYDNTSPRSSIRMIAILASVILGTSFQITLTEDKTDIGARESKIDATSPTTILQYGPGLQD